MNTLIPFLFINVFCFLFPHFISDLPYMPVSFHLSTSKTTYRLGERIPFKLSIKNGDKYRSYPIILPGSQNKGKKLVMLQAFHVNPKTGFYTCVAKENPEIKMTGTPPGSLAIRNLKPGDSLELVFFLNDTINYLTHTASHHAIEPQLQEGSYKFLIYYDPSVTEFKSFYHYIRTTNDSSSALKLNFWIGGNVSNYTDIRLIK